jgi:hypothetical protein
VWIRPVVGGYEPDHSEPGLPPYAFSLEVARPRSLAFTGVAGDAAELVFDLVNAQRARIRPAGPATFPELERWDTFYYTVLTAQEEAELDLVAGDSYWGPWA